MPYEELFFKKLEFCEFVPKIRYRLKLFSVKKLESILIISELNSICFDMFSSRIISPGVNA